MNILVTGNLGYIGTVLVPMLKDLGHNVTGYDIGYFKNCLLTKTISSNHQFIGDIRKIEAENLINCDAVIHLAGLSNDPLGELNPSLTYDINFGGTIRIAELAKKAGVGRFIFASSQSIYGISDTSSEIDEYESIKAPVTEYAKTKWLAEIELNKLCDDNFHVVSFRPSTVFGASPRLRCDIVYNNFLGCAYTMNRIEIKSDGTPWRPVVHIKDVNNAFISGILAPKDIVSGRAFNVGILNGNYTVRDIAEAAAKILPKSDIVYTGEYGNDERTYRVSFNRIFNELGNFYKPTFDLTSGGKELLELFHRSHFNYEQFTGPITNRLKKINEMIQNGELSHNLDWI